MDNFDDLPDDDQPLPFSPSWFPPSPDPFEIMEFPQNGESGGLVATPAMNEANPSTSAQQNPPDMVDLFSNSNGFQQQDFSSSDMLNAFQDENVSLMQQQPEYQQQDLFNPNLLDSFQDPDFSLMEQLLASSDGYQQADQEQQQQLLYNSDGNQEQFDLQDLINPNMLNSFQQRDVSLMGNIPNTQSDQQHLLYQSMMNSFPEPSASTRVDIGRRVEEEYSGFGFGHQPLIDSFELPIHPQEQLLPVPLSEGYPSFPTYQHGPVASHLNMNDQQPPPSVVATNEDRPLAPRMDTDLARTSPQENQVSTMTTPPSVPSSSTSQHGNVQELVNQPSPTTRRYREIRPRPTPFFPPPTWIPPPQSIVLGRRQRNHQNQFEQGESSSSAQRRRVILPRRDDDSTAVGIPQERIQNYLYSQNYESLGIPVDPHLRNFFPPRRRP